MKTLMITTGGTLACKKTNEGLMPVLKGDDILEFAKDRSLIDVYDFRLIDSSIMTDDDRKELSEIILKNKDDYDSFIITHGTDSLSFTAAYLECSLYNLNKTIVITGSQLPLVYENTDAIDNLNKSIEIAKGGYYGVCAVIFNRVIPAKTITKIETEGFLAFDSIDKKYIEKPISKTDKEFKMRVMNDKKIDITYITPVLKKEEILKKKDYTDIIVLALGAGGMLESQLEGFRAVLESDVRVHLKSQCLYGKIEDVYEAHKGVKEFNILNNISLEYAVYAIKFSLI